MIREELKQLPTGPRELRKFGLTVGLVLAAIGAWYLYRGKSFAPYVFWPGAVLLAAGAIVPRSLRHVYIAWMALAFTLGLVVSTILLTVFFYLVVTPIGLVARLAGKDFLGLKLDPKASTYWIPRPPADPQKPRDYDRQF